MSKVIVVTDSNSGITPDEAKKLGVEVIPMPFYIDEQMYYENIDLTQEQFYEKLTAGGDIKTSMPLVGDVTDKWDEFLKENDEIVYIPMSSGLSSSCETAYMLSQDYDGKVQVVNNQRISVTMRQSVIDAKNLAEAGKNAAEIKQILEDAKFESSIYIMVDTLNYLKKGGRITPAAAALGTLLKLKPVLQIQGEKLDAFAKARTVKQAKSIMIDAMKSDFEKRFNNPDGSQINLEMAYTHDIAAAEAFKEEVQAAFPNNEIVMNPLSETGLGPLDDFDGHVVPLQTQLEQGGGDGVLLRPSGGLDPFHHGQFSSFCCSCSGCWADCSGAAVSSGTGAWTGSWASGAAVSDLGSGCSSAWAFLASCSAFSAALRSFLLMASWPNSRLGSV